MSNTKKWLLGIGIVGILCMCAAVVAFFVVRQVGSQVAQSFKTDPTGVAHVGSRIADYDIPPGYSQVAGMSLLVYDFVMYAPTDNTQGTAILLMQFKSGTAYSSEQMQQIMQQQSGRRGLTTQIVKTYQATIRGQTSTIVIQDSTTADQQGIILRQLFTVFPGKGGTVMLMIMGPKDAWDQSLADKFISSIH
jgi:hypothetical protein